MTTAVATSPSPWLLPVRQAGWGIVLLAALLVIILLRLVPEWSNNPDLSHGFFTPILFGLLIHESRTRGPWNYLPDGGWLAGAIGVLMAAGLVTLVTASLFASALDWTHALVEFLLGAALILGLTAAWLHCASRSVRLVPANWISFIAIALWVLSLPVPPGTYLRMTLSLQLWVTNNVLHSLLLLGIPAEQNGNIIQLANTSVGVEEACSGIRSLISCIYAGLFFSASFVRRWPGRMAIVLLAAPIAIVMNFLRSLLLTLLAYRGVDIAGTWHDVTGFAILAVTAVILGGLALVIEKLESRGEDSADPTEPAPAPTVSSGNLARVGRWMLAGGFGAALACVLVFVALTRPAATYDAPPADLIDYLPAQPDGWDLVATEDLFRFSEILATTHLVQRTYLKREGSDGEPVQITVYLAYWPPGQAPVSLVASHTPDACWPGSGWVPQEDVAQRMQLPLTPDRTLSAAEYRYFEKSATPQHVWFWHAYNRHVIQEFDPRRPAELLKSVLQYGVRSEGDQIFVRLSSNRPWNEIRDEPVVQTVFANIAAFGI